MNKYLSGLRSKGGLSAKAPATKWYTALDKAKWDYVDKTDSTQTNNQKLFLLMTIISKTLDCPVDLVVEQDGYHYLFSMVLSDALEKELIELLRSNSDKFLDSFRRGQVLLDRNQHIKMDILTKFLSFLSQLNHESSVLFPVSNLHTSDSLYSQLFPNRSVKFFALQKSEPKTWVQLTLLSDELETELSSPERGQLQWNLLELLDYVRRDLNFDGDSQRANLVNLFSDKDVCLQSGPISSEQTFYPVSLDKNGPFVKGLSHVVEDNPITKFATAFLPQSLQSLLPYVNPMGGFRYLFPAQFNQFSNVDMLLHPSCSIVLQRNGIPIQIFYDLGKIIGNDRGLREVIERILSKICRKSISDEPQKIHALVQESSFLAICYEPDTGEPSGIVSIMKWRDPSSGREIIYPAATVLMDTIKDSGLTEYLNNYFFQECLMRQAQTRLRQPESPVDLNVVIRSCNPRILGTIWSYYSAVPNSSHVPLFLSLRMLHSLKRLGMSSSKNENDDLLHVLGRIISHAPFQKEVR